MSILRHSKLKNSKPKVENSPVPRFIESVRKTLDIPVYDKNGNIIKTFTKAIVEHKIIDQKEFLNEGVDCDLFSVENLQKAGVNPQIITTPLLKASLEQKSIVSDYVEGFDYETLIEKPNDPNDPNDPSNIQSSNI